MARRRRRKKASGGAGVSFLFSWIGPLFSFLLSRIAYIVLVLAVVGLGVFIRHYCLESDQFNLQSLMMNKTRHMTRSEILKKSGIEFGENIFQMDLKSAAKRLESFPRVRKAVFKRRLPESLQLQIDEREEIAQIKLPFRNKYYLIDSEGAVLDPVLHSPQPGVVIVEADFSRETSLVPGSFFRPDAILKTFALIEFCKDENVFPNEKIQKISIDTADNLTMILGDDLKIKFGANPESLFGKIPMLSNVISGALRSDIDYIDLRFKDIVVRKK